MRKTIQALVLLAWASTFAIPAKAQEGVPIDVSVTYTAERAKIASAPCGCFWLQGGSADGVISLYRGLAAAVNVTGEHAANITSGVDLNKISVMAGPRYELWTGRWSDRYLGARHTTTLFGEALFGYVHGFGSLFPTGSGTTASANAFSMQIGGGINMRLTRTLGIRAFEADYVRTSLPNGASNSQDDLRLSIGVTYHIHPH